MRFFALADRNLKEIYRDPLSIGLGVIMPVVFLMLFISIGRNAPIEAFTPNALTPGIIVFSFAFLTMFSAILLSKDRQSEFLTRLLTTPLRPIDFILAYSIPFIPIAFLQIAVCFTVGILFGITLNFNVLVSLVVLIPMAFACIGIGMVIGSLCTENQVAGIGSMVIVVASLFGGAWMDLKMVGGVFNAVGYILPFAHAIDATRAILKGTDFGVIASNLYWVIGYTICFFALGILSFRWKTKR
jgi:ABC-2 type transport system permease protein